MLSASFIALTRFVDIRHPISSSRGSVSFFSGATRVWFETIETLQIPVASVPLMQTMHHTSPNALLSPSLISMFWMREW
jgi:hypothetical protein